MARACSGARRFRNPRLAGKLVRRLLSPENVTPNILQICAKAKTSSAVK